MRIAIFTDSYKPQVNGVVTSIDIFTHELRRRGHSVYIFAPEIPGYAEKEPDVFRMKSIKFSNYDGYWLGLPFSLMFRDFPEVDIVHVHSPFSMGLAGLAYARHRKVPCVATFHTMYSEYSHYFIKNRMISDSKTFRKIFKDLSWKYLRWFHNRADVVIAPSDYIMKILKRKKIGKSVVIVPTGVHFRKSGQSKKSLRKKYGFGRNDRIMLHVGRITKEKNIEFVIDSLKHLLSDDARLVITSEGPAKEVLQKKVVDMKLAGKVVFTGYLDEKELREFYRLSDVFVMASRTETQGLVLLDAATSGLPSVVIEAPVISDFVRSNNIGLVAQKKDFADSVSRLLSSPALRRKFSSNCGKIIGDYSPEKCAARLLSAYDSAML